MTCQDLENGGIGRAWEERDPEAEMLREPRKIYGCKASYLAKFAILLHFSLIIITFGLYLHHIDRKALIEITRTNSTISWINLYCL